MYIRTCVLLSLILMRVCEIFTFILPVCIVSHVGNRDLLITQALHSLKKEIFCQV